MYRDGFSDLRVGIALKVLHESVLAAIQTQAEELNSTGTVAKMARAAGHLQMLDYLKQLKSCFPDFFLNNKFKEARISAPADLSPARDLYLYLRLVTAIALLAPAYFCAITNVADTPP